MSGLSSSGMVDFWEDLRGIAIFPNGLVETMVGAKAETEVNKVRRKATVFMVLASRICGGSQKQGRESKTRCGHGRSAESTGDRDRQAKGRTRLQGGGKAREIRHLPKITLRKVGVHVFVAPLHFR